MKDPLKSGFRYGTSFLLPHSSPPADSSCDPKELFSNQAAALSWTCSGNLSLYTASCFQFWTNQTKSTKNWAGWIKGNYETSEVSSSKNQLVSAGEIDLSVDVLSPWQEKQNWPEKSSFPAEETSFKQMSLPNSKIVLWTSGKSVATTQKKGEEKLTAVVLLTEV